MFPQHLLPRGVRGWANAAKWPKHAYALIVWYPCSWLDYWIHRNRFTEVDTFACFIGYPRTGHTLLSALINAHPSAMMSNELKPLLLFRLGFNWRQVFALIYRRDRYFSRWDYTQTQTGYKYEVPGAEQGSWTRGTLIGDKSAEATAAETLRDPELFDTIRQGLDGRRLRVIHHVRSPYDSIATIARRNKVPVARALRKYSKLLRAVNQSRPGLSSDEFLTTYHEDLVANPKQELERVCRFLGLDTDESYLDACAAIIFEKPQRTRQLIDWTSEEEAAVVELCRQTDFLQRYADEGV